MHSEAFGELHVWKDLGAVNDLSISTITASIPFLFSIVN